MGPRCQGSAFAASRPGRLRVDPKGNAVYEGKRGGLGRAGRAESNLSAIPVS